MAITGWSDAETVEYVGNYLVGRASGESDDDIRGKLDLTHAKFRQLKQEALSREKAHRRGQTTEDVFLEYRMNQDRLVGWLEKIAVPETKAEVKTVPQAAPQVAAIKAIADINDRVIKTGQELGILERASDPGHGPSVNIYASMTASELRKVITGMVGNLASWEKKYGSKNIIEAEYGETYRDLPEAKPVGKFNRAATGRTSGARRRVAKQKALE